MTLNLRLLLEDMPLGLGSRGPVYLGTRVSPQDQPEHVAVKVMKNWNGKKHVYPIVVLHCLKPLRVSSRRKVYFIWLENSFEPSM